MLIKDVVYTPLPSPPPIFPAVQSQRQELLTLQVNNYLSFGCVVIYVSELVELLQMMSLYIK